MNNRSPNSSSLLSRPSHATAWRSSATSSSILSTTSSLRGQSKPTAATRLPISWARSREGRVAGTPASSDRGVPASVCSFALICSHCSTTSPALTNGRPWGSKMCGCRRISFVADRRQRVHNRERSGVGGNLRQEHTFENQVADLASERRSIAAVDRLQHLVGFFEQEPAQRRERLFPVPWTTVRPAEVSHDVHQPLERRTGRREHAIVRDVECDDVLRAARVDARALRYASSSIGGP